MPAGRAFEEHDTTNSPGVAIVNETFARELLNGSNLIGKTFRAIAEPGDPETTYQIVGVVKDTISVERPLPALAAQVKSAVSGVSPDILIYFRVFKTMVRDHLVDERVMAMFSGFFAALATLLAIIGL